MASDKSEVYKSGNGDYLIFVEDEYGKTKTYTVFSKSEKGGKAYGIVWANVRWAATH